MQVRRMELYGSGFECTLPSVGHRLGGPNELESPPGGVGNANARVSNLQPHSVCGPSGDHVFYVVVCR